jgi:hypothetical protein
MFIDAMFASQGPHLWIENMRLEGLGILGAEWLNPNTFLNGSLLAGSPWLIMNKYIIDKWRANNKIP